MAMIEQPFEINKAHRKTIDAKEKEPDFSHTSWADEDLMSLRSDIRQYYKNQQRGFCAYCKNSVSLEGAGNCHIEHVAPKSIYIEWMFHAKNLCVICSDCNTIKRAQEVIGEIPDTIQDGSERKLYPRSSKSFKIAHPHFDEWDRHILKFNNAYVDRTTKGGFTIQACKLNRFFHKFGFDADHAEDYEVSSLMTEYLECESRVRSAQILIRLREILFEVA